MPYPRTQALALQMLALHGGTLSTIELGFAGVPAISLMRLREIGLVHDNVDRFELTEAGRDAAAKLAD